MNFVLIILLLVLFIIMFTPKRKEMYDDQPATMYSYVPTYEPSWLYDSWLFYSPFTYYYPYGFYPNMFY